ncbi:hypothetical protein [Rhabdochromatium marinum]|uniref:hypothetical protein n=1 Tax=Rhabdochromatium marinum TaxID=48729 RepID=UPI00190878D0|nr:hypothetical protein [Rhabdochromatium marinum]MBK1649488.1 hypothetical protein [Rhabdochromatium marinum]
MHDEAQQEAAPTAPAAGGETVARVMTGLNMLCGRAEQLDALRKEALDSELPTSVNAVDIGLHLNEFIHQTERALEQVIDSDVPPPPAAVADAISEAQSGQLRVPDETGIAALPSMQCGLAALRLEVRMLINGVDDITDDLQDPVRLERLEKRLDHARKTLGEFSGLRERAQQELSEQLEKAAIANNHPTDDAPVDSLAPEPPVEPVEEQTQPLVTADAEAGDLFVSTEDMAEISSVASELLSVIDLEDHEELIPVEAIELEPEPESELEPESEPEPEPESEPDPELEPDLEQEPDDAPASQLPHAQAEPQEDEAMAESRETAAEASSIEDVTEPPTDQQLDQPPGKDDATILDALQTPQDQVEAVVEDLGVEKSATDDLGMDDLFDEDPSQPSADSQAEAPAVEDPWLEETMPEEAMPEEPMPEDNEEPAVADMTKQDPPDSEVPEENPIIPPLAAQAVASSEDAVAEEDAAAAQQQQVSGKSLHQAWSDSLTQVKRHMALGLGAVAGLALGLFGLGWWLLGSGTEDGGSSNTLAQSAQLKPELVQGIESRLATIEGNFDRVDERLSRLEQQAAARLETADAARRQASGLAAVRPVAAEVERGRQMGLGDQSLVPESLENTPAQLAIAATDTESAAGVAGGIPGQLSDQAAGQELDQRPDQMPDQTADQDAAASPAAAAIVAAAAAAAATDVAAKPNTVVLTSVRYGIQIAAFALANSAFQFALEKSADGQSLYFFRSGPEGKMIAVIQGLYTTNQEVANDLLALRRAYPKAWPRRFDPGTRLTLFKPTGGMP